MRLHDRFGAWRWALLALAPLLAGVTCGIGQEDLVERTLTAALEGAQVVPPVETSATGSATARLLGNSLRIQGSFSGLTGPVLRDDGGGVLLRLGPPGENGPTIAVLFAASVDGKTGTFEFGGLVSDELVDAFLAGDTYVEVRTEAFPAGELRAQLR